MNCPKCETAINVAGKCKKHRETACYDCQVKFTPKLPWEKRCGKCRNIRKNSITRADQGAIQ